MRQIMKLQSCEMVGRVTKAGRRLGKEKLEGRGEAEEEERKKFLSTFVLSCLSPSSVPAWVALD